MTISKKIRIAIVLSGIWSAIVLFLAIHDANRMSFRFAEFFMALTVGAILPLLIVWGIIWICSSPKEEKNKEPKDRTS